MLPLLPTLALLPFTLFIGLWVAWSDMATMKIPNKAVLSLIVVYLAVGVLTLPLMVWLWGIGVGAATLIVLFIANAAGLMGAGDSKFGAAMAPFFVLADYRMVMALLAVCLLAAFVTHRLLRAIPPVRRATPDWQSWTHKKFPMGLALGGMLNFYLIAAPLSPLLRFTSS